MSFCATYFDSACALGLPFQNGSSIAGSRPLPLCTSLQTNKAMKKSGERNTGADTEDKSLLMYAIF